VIAPTPAVGPRERGDLSIPAARAAVLAWYQAHGRALAFRSSRDPWGVLVAEVLAQQTQAQRAATAWLGFMARFPTPAALAAATPADVLRAWRGLGYNRRALRLQLAARVILAEHGGRVPGDVAALERLPGVGRYTARAVAATAFDVPVAALDTNVRRVIGRVAGMTGGDAVTARRVEALADAAVPPENPATWTHALMDIGATVCVAAAPRCGACPVAPWCRSRGRAVTRIPARGGPARASTGASARFPATNRWLRGRILDRCRDAASGGWVDFEEHLGEHDLAAVRAAVVALADEGLIELAPVSAPGGVLAARLPLA
jgi:A/G-specific adenine glycosylase